MQNTSKQYFQLISSSVEWGDIGAFPHRLTQYHIVVEIINPNIKKSKMTKLTNDRINVVDENGVNGRKYHRIETPIMQMVSSIKNAGSSLFHIPFAWRWVVIILLIDDGLKYMLLSCQTADSLSIWLNLKRRRKYDSLSNENGIFVIWKKFAFHSKKWKFGQKYRIFIYRRYDRYRSKVILWAIRKTLLCPKSHLKHRSHLETSSGSLSNTSKSSRFFLS